jgi:DNA polymerase elongation subunit (family B)
MYNSVAKLMSNSLYGRLGLSPRSGVTKIVSEQTLYELFESGTVISYRGLNRHYLVTIKSNKHDRAVKGVRNVALAAATTSKARIKLYNAQTAVINSGGRILYSDTDSIYAVYKNNMRGKSIDDIT